MMRRIWSWLCVPVLVVGFASVAVPALAQDSAEYVIGPGDVISVSVWLHQELERTVTVSPRGTIIYPPLGEIQAGGFTVKDLAARIGDRLSTYLRQTTTATVTVTQFVSRSVIVTGAVYQPGRRGYETLPSIVDVIQDAGGGLPGADLGRIQIIRREGQERRVISVDVGAALQGGTVSQLPPLEPGDVIVVPTSAAAVGTLTSDAAGVLGEVQHAGLYPVGDGMDLWMVLSLAGGPTQNSNLSAIRVLTKERDAATAVTVNLKETLTRGNRSPYIVRPGDIVYLSPRGPSPLSLFNLILATTRDVASVVVLADVLRKQK